MIKNNKKSTELWAILDSDGKIMWSSGGSSTSPKLMVFESEIKAKRSLSSYQTKRWIFNEDVKIVKIYSA